MGERRSKWMGCCGEATLCQYAMDSYNTWCYDVYHFILFVLHLDYHDDNLITNENRYQPAELVQSFLKCRPVQVTRTLQGGTCDASGFVYLRPCCSHPHPLRNVNLFFSFLSVLSLSDETVK